jgi:hypothetical protein
MTFTIREATPADVPALAVLHVTTFSEARAPTLRNGASRASSTRSICCGGTIAAGWAAGSWATSPDGS